LVDDFEFVIPEDIRDDLKFGKFEKLVQDRANLEISPECNATGPNPKVVPLRYTFDDAVSGPRL